MSHFGDIGNSVNPDQTLRSWRRRTRRLIRAFTVCNMNIYSKQNKNYKVHQTSLKLEMDSSNW